MMTLGRLTADLVAVLIGLALALALTGASGQ